MPPYSPSHRRKENLLLYRWLMFPLIEKIEKALESKSHCTLIDKLGKYYHGTVVDSWVRLSGGKIRGKLTFLSSEKGQFEIEANDVLDLQFTKEKT